MDLDYAPNMRGYAAEPAEMNHTAGSDYDPEDSEYLEVVSPAGSYDEASGASNGSRSVRWFSPSKRQAEPHTDQAPPKRRKRGFNHDYMNLLNADIEDAANQLVMEPIAPNTPRLHQTQVGLTVWTPLEKDLFFEAVGRLGRDDLLGISSRIRTKSEVEVRQYLQLFDDTLKTRQDDLHLRWEDVLQMADYPAAVELSENCYDALDEAADDLAARVERHEQKQEQRKWGSECWVIDAQLAKEMNSHKDSVQENHSRLTFARLFHLQAWLKLSEQMFMNSAVPGENWQSLEEEEEEELPKMRATALEDFHSLAVSVTKKIMLSSLHVAESRIRAKRAVKPNTKGLVKTRDVEAAVASLKLKPDRQRYWATAARRLGVHVYDGPLPEDSEDSGGSDDEGNNEEQQGPLSYDDVEAQLIPETPAQIRRREKLARQPSTKSQIMDLIDFELSDRESSSSSESAPDDSEIDDFDLAFSIDGGGRDAGAIEKSKADVEEDAAVRSEAREVLLYSAHEFPQTERAKEALVSRIRLGREQEAYADAVDARASREEETNMWRLLKAPVPLAAKPEPVVNKQGKEVKRPRQSVLGLEEMHDYGARWRERLVYASEWETLGHMGSWDRN